MKIVIVINARSNRRMYLDTSLGDVAIRQFVLVGSGTDTISLLILLFFLLGRPSS